MNKDLVIEKLNVDVFADQQESNNRYLLEINRELQEIILPKLEQAIEKMNHTEVDVELDRLDVEWKTEKTENWSEDVVETLVEKITDEINAQLEYKKSNNKTKTAQTLSEKLQGLIDLPVNGFHENEEELYAFLRFLKSGFLVKSTTNSVQKLEAKLTQQFNQNLAKSLAGFLLKNPQAFIRFTQNLSTEFHTKLFEQHFTPEWTQILTEMVVFESKLDKNNQKWLHFALKMIQNEEKDILSQFQEHQHYLRQDLVDYIQQTEKPQPAVQQLLHALSMTDHSNSSASKQKTNDPQSVQETDVNQPLEIQHFIQFLQRDPSLKTLLNRLLSKQLDDHPQTFSTFEAWQLDFIERFTHAPELKQLLNHLEHYEPIQNETIETEDPKLQYERTQAFLAAIEKRLTILNAQHIEKQEAAATSTKTLFAEEDIHTPNSGAILLHPFLPQLFKTLHLLNDNNEWQSPTAQTNALFAIHYLATGQIENITEDQLILPKILTGMAIDEELSTTYDSEGFMPFSSKQGATFLTNLNSEMDALLEAIHENWHPMRNCTWSGLRNDFLNRPGTLELKNEQLILTIEPHTFDILLPHKNWGHSMVKFSWMDAVVIVEWG